MTPCGATYPIRPAIETEPGGPEEPKTVECAETDPKHKGDHHADVSKRTDLGGITEIRWSKP